MEDERIYILKMLEAGTITSQDAAKLLDALESQEPISETEITHIAAITAPEIANTEITTTKPIQQTVAIDLGPAPTPEPPVIHVAHSKTTGCGRPAWWRWLGVNLDHTRLAGTQLDDALFWGVNLDSADLRNADCRGAKIIGVNLDNANLQGANLQNATIIGVNLDNADLAGVNLENATIFGVNMDSAKLTDADLKGQQFMFANLDNFQIEQQPAA